MTLGDQLRRLAPFLPAGIVILAWGAWSHFEGGYFPLTWYPSAIAAICLLVATAFGTGRILPPAKPARFALGALAAVVAWSFLSIVWSGSQGSGWASSDQLLLYLAVAWIVALLPWTLETGRLAAMLWVLVVVVVCAISLIGAAGAEHVGEFFIEGRYLDPIGYPNGVSALPLMAFFPALWLCSRPGATPLTRAVFLGAAVFLVEFALLPQSRAAVIGLVFGALAFVALVPARVRLVPPLIVVGAAVALSVDQIYHVYTVGIELSEAVEAGRRIPGLRLGPAVDDAAWAIALTTAGAALCGAVIGALDRRIELSRERSRQVSRGFGIATAAVLAAALVVALVNAGSISDDLSNRWDTFKSSKETPATTGARLTANYSDQRYDYWRVAWQEFERKPLAGAGAGSYEDVYNRNRDFDKPSKYPHDIWLRFLSEGGVVAFALFLGFLAALGVGLAAAWRRLETQGRGFVAVCASVLVYFLAHASFDWLDQFPALASPALALPFIGIAVGADALRREQGGRARAGIAVLAFVAVAALASLAFPYLAERHLEKGSDIGLADVAAAREELDRAAALDPLSPEARLRAGTILVAAEDQAGARREFERALEVEDNWYAHYELALIASEAGRRGLALSELRKARELNRHDLLLRDTLRKIEDGKQLDAAAQNSDIRRIQAQRFTRPET